jgi:ribosomal protein S18 acetylase RimI-like enzyme
MVNDSARAIRPARLADAVAVAGLLGELGYPTSGDHVRERLERVLPRRDGGVLAAVVRGEVVGFAAYELIQLLHRAQPQCRLTTLVVRSDQRRRGLARALVDELESVARRRGCFRLEVTTQPDRGEARAFYEALDFDERPLRLVKPL